MNYYISDLHIGHENVIKLDHRPFADTDEMFDAIVSNWNKTVKGNDTVYILGDFIWKKKNEWAEIVKQLKGKKVLIRGNHDPKEFSDEVRALFVDIKDYMEIQDGQYKVVLCHYPLLSYFHDFSPNVVMVYGHVHNTLEMNLVQEFRQKLWAKNSADNKWPLGQLLHAGCMEEYMSYTPRTLQEIIKGDIAKYGSTEKPIIVAG